MLKHHRQGAAPTGNFSISWKPTLLMSIALVMLLLPLCIINSVLVFHFTFFAPRPNFLRSSASHNGSIHHSLEIVNQSSPKVVLNRKQPIMQAIREESPHIFSLSHYNHCNSTPSEENVLEARKQQERIEEETKDLFPKEPHQNVNGSEIKEEVEYKALGDPSEEKVLKVRNQQEQIEEETGDLSPKEPHQNVNGSEIEEEVEAKALGDPTASLDKPPLNQNVNGSEIEEQVEDKALGDPIASLDKPPLNQNVNGSEIEEEVEDKALGDPIASLDKPPLNQNANGSEIEEEVEDKALGDPIASLDKPPLNQNVNGSEIEEEVEDKALGDPIANLDKPPLNQNVNGNEIEDKALGDPIASLDKPPLNVSIEERIKWFTQNLASFKILHSDSLSSHFRSKAKSFFNNCTLHFFMTWISSPEAFGPRELLSVESVFKWHPSACLLIISRSMDSEIGRKILDPFVGRGFRVMAAAPDLTHLFKGTAAETWLRNVKAGKIDPGEISFAQNLSNIIRLAALHMYGGIYMDSDVIILKSMAKLENVIGAQSVDPSGQWNRLNNAVLVFKKTHPLVTEFMKEFARTFNGNKWGYNGPYLVTRVVKHLPKGSKIRFQVLPPMAFYPVDWTRIQGYFIRHASGRWSRWRKAKLLQMEFETYAVHLWNKQSRQLQVEEDSIIHHIFNKSCVLCHDKHFLHNNFTM